MFTLPLDQQAHLSTLYSQSYRKYHNITHIINCLNELNNNINEISQEFAFLSRDYIEKCLVYAIWYHDAIYDPYAKSGDNENLSVELFRNYNYDKFDRENELGKFETISAAIFATSWHTLPELPKCIMDIPGHSVITKLMLDIDLAGIGKSVAEFNQNTTDIYGEYYKPFTMDIIDNRRKFFQKLNEKPCVYYTNTFRNLYEQQAKLNIEMELKILNNKI